MASNSFTPEIPLTHPFADDTHIRPNNIRDSLENCISTLHMLSGLFTDEENDSCDSAQVRRGTFLQLQSVASVLEAIETCLGQEAEIKFTEWKAEREADREARQATKERIEADPEVIAKTTILAKAFAQVCREVMADSPNQPAGDNGLTLAFTETEFSGLTAIAERYGKSVGDIVQAIVADAARVFAPESDNESVAISDDLHFGGCPDCRKPGYYLNVHKDHWFLCDEHKTCWNVGSNLFSSWMHEDEATWERNKAKLQEYTIVKPWYPENS